MSESPEEVSDRIIRGHTNSEGQWVTSPSLVRESILSALRNERERCAKLLEKRSDQYALVDGVEADITRIICTQLAEAIREGR